jgi:hypothetical protein
MFDKFYYEERDKLDLDKILIKRPVIISYMEDITREQIVKVLEVRPESYYYIPDKMKKKDIDLTLMCDYCPSMDEYQPVMRYIMCIE